MRKMNTNPTLFASYLTSTDENWWVRGVEPNAIYELRYGPYVDDPEWDYDRLLIDTHMWTATFAYDFEDSYNGLGWPIRVHWSTTNRTIEIYGVWGDRVDQVSKWRLELWRVA